MISKTKIKQKCYGTGRALCNKLNNQDVKEIKYLLEKTNMSQSDIAKKYPIGQGRMSRISNGKCWTHIESKNKPNWL